MAGEDALWIARLRAGESGPFRTVRIRTAGEAPSPDHVVEEIVDPFAVCSEDEASTADPWEVANEAKVLADGLSGALKEYSLGVPLRPSKVLGIGRNYRAHAAELGNDVPTRPLIFFKPPSCLLASGQPILLPEGYERIDMEAELVVVIGRRASAVTKERAWEHVAGYTLGNDVSCRDLQKSDGQWARAKGFDSFGPCGPFIRMTKAGLELDGQARIQGFLDDEGIQDAPVGDMVFSIPTLIETISACMRLEPGDLIFTGTPAGVSALSPGRICRVEMAGLELASLTNPVLRRPG